MDHLRPRFLLIRIREVQTQEEWGLLRPSSDLHPSNNLHLSNGDPRPLHGDPLHLNRPCRQDHPSDDQEGWRGLLHQTGRFWGKGDGVLGRDFRWSCWFGGFGVVSRSRAQKGSKVREAGLFLSPSHIPEHFPCHDEHPRCVFS